MTNKNTVISIELYGIGCSWGEFESFEEAKARGEDIRNRWNDGDITLHAYYWKEECCNLRIVERKIVTTTKTTFI